MLKFAPIMPTFCSSLLPFCYSNNFAGKIYASLPLYHLVTTNVSHSLQVRKGSLWIMYLSKCRYICKNYSSKAYSNMNKFYLKQNIIFLTNSWSMFICDWASENGASGYIKFHHMFQLFCIIINDLQKPLK